MYYIEDANVISTAGVAALSEAVEAAYRSRLWVLNKALEGYNPE